MVTDFHMVTRITPHGIGVDMAILTDMDMVMDMVIMDIIILTMDIIVHIGTMIIMATIPDIIMAIITNQYTTDPAVLLQTAEHPHQMHLTGEEHPVHVLQPALQPQAL